MAVTAAERTSRSLTDVAAARDRTRLLLLEAALSSPDVEDLFEKSVAILFANLPLEGAGVWLADSGGKAARLKFHAGDVRSLEQCRLISTTDLSEASLCATLKAMLRVATRKDNESFLASSPKGDGVHVASFSYGSGLCGIIAVWLPAPLFGLFPVGRWLYDIFAPAFEALRVVVHARESLSITTALMRSATDAIVGIDLDGRCQLWNPAAESLFGWPAADVLNRPLRIGASEDESRWRECLDMALVSGRATNHALTGQRWDGERLELDAVFIPLRRNNREFPNLLLCLRDHTEERECRRWLNVVSAAADVLRGDGRIEDRARDLLNSLCRVGSFEWAELWLTSADGLSWRRCGEQGDDFGGRPENFDQSQHLLCEVRSRRSIVRLSETSGVGLPGRSAPQPKGSSAVVGVPVLSATGLEAVLIVSEKRSQALTSNGHQGLKAVSSLVADAIVAQKQRDALREIREQLVQAEKLESLGMLTTGVAHDLNNILTVVFGYCAIASAGSPAALSQSLREIEQAAEKASLLTRQLLRFGRKSPLAIDVLNISGALADLTPLLTSLIGSRITLHISAPPSSLAVHLARTEFDQLILNIAANARDAMPDGGSLRITADFIESSLRDLAACPQLRSGPCIRLSFTDSGCGMTENIRNKMFEPFFTTKKPGSGTGVGLATVKQIVDRASGGILVDSEPGQGTTLTVLLPRVAAGLCSRIVTDQPTSDPRGTESILILEGDSRLRQILQRILELKGYRVRAAQDLKTAESQLPDAGDAPELVIVEWSQLAAAEHSVAMGRLASKSGLLVIADAETELSSIRLKFAAVGSLVKPFSSHELATAVRTVIDNR